jgi:hypothetical protein
MKPMTSGTPKPTAGSKDLADVPYVCETCGTESVRRIKLNDRDPRMARPKRRTSG